MKLSYLVTVHNETYTLVKLLERLVNNRFEGDEIVILNDNSDITISVYIVLCVS